MIVQIQLLFAFRQVCIQHEMRVVFPAVTWRLHVHRLFCWFAPDGAAAAHNAAHIYNGSEGRL